MHMHSIENVATVYGATCHHNITETVTTHSTIGAHACMVWPGWLVCKLQTGGLVKLGMTTIE